MDTPASPARSVAALRPEAGVIELGRLAGDTVGDRRWRIVTEDGGFVLQCEAMRPGGWMSVTREPTMLDVRRFAAWCGLTIEAAAVEPVQELALCSGRGCLEGAQHERAHV